MDAENKSNTDNNYGEIQLVFKLVDKKYFFNPLFHRSEHSIAKIRNLPWTLSLVKKDQIKVTISCNEDSSSNVWKCEADIALEINYHDVRSDTPTKMETIFEGRKFDFNKRIMEETVEQWIDVFNGKIELKGAITVTAKVKVTKLYGYRKRKMLDFSTNHPDYFDGVLLVENKKIYVQKRYLATKSTYFWNIFFGDFKEKEQEAVEIPGVKYDDVIQFLNFIHHTDSQINIETIENMMVLADLFLIDCLMCCCEKILIKADSVNLAKKLIWAERFALNELMDHCLDGFKKMQDFVEFRKNEFYAGVSDDIKSTLLDRVMKIKGYRYL